MIAKISRNKSLFSALDYNNKKVQHSMAEIVLLHNMREKLEPHYTTKELWYSFMPYVVNNLRKRKEAIHISMNPHPFDAASRETYLTLIQQYMQKMGYGNQPYVVFEHTDLQRLHYHIVSVGVNEYGKVSIPQYDYYLSQRILRELEIQHCLLVTPFNKQNKQIHDFNVVDIQKGDLKSQLSGVLRAIPKNYFYQDIESYNALLSLFYIKAVEVEPKGKQKFPKPGLVYFATDCSLNIKSPPFKSSNFGHGASFSFLEGVFNSAQHTSLQKQSEQRIKRHLAIGGIEYILSPEFMEGFKQSGINVVSFWKKGSLDFYFIDHFNKYVLPLNVMISKGLKKRVLQGLLFAHKSILGGTKNQEITQSTNLNITSSGSKLKQQL